MAANDSMPSLWSRRSLLFALAAGSVTAVSGCGVQLEEGAPRIPLVPTRVPMVDEKALLAVLGRATSLGSLARAAGGARASIAGQLIGIHANQVAVISRLLRDGGVPQTLIAATRQSTPPTSSPPSSSPPSSSPPTSSPPTTRPPSPAAELAAAESDSVSDIALADLSTAHVTLIGSMLAQRIASATLLGGTPPPVASSGLDGAEAVPILEAVRAAVYGFEVVAAQIDRTGRALAMSTLMTLRARALELRTLAGASATPPPLGYELPFAVADGDSARRLALHLLDALLTDQAAALGQARGDPAALVTLVRWLGQTQVIATRWGAPLRAFPGLSNS